MLTVLPGPVYPLGVPRVNVHGVELHVEQAGEGPDALFVSGLADEAGCWAEQVAALSGRYRLTVFDNRGVGRSSTPPGPYRIADFAADTIGLMDALGLDRVHLVGSSMGGAIAQEVVLAAPERVRTLVLSGTWCRGDRFLREVFLNWIWVAQRADSVRDFLTAVNLWAFAPRVWNDGRMDRWLDEAAASPHPQSVEAFTRSAEALLTHDTADRLGAVDVPALVTVGDLDLVLPPRFSEEIAARIPGARLEVFRGAGHQPFMEMPDEFNALIAGFWESAG